MRGGVRDGCGETESVVRWRLEAMLSTFGKDEVQKIVKT